MPGEDCSQTSQKEKKKFCGLICSHRAEECVKKPCQNYCSSYHNVLLNSFNKLTIKCFYYLSWEIVAGAGKAANASPMLTSQLRSGTTFKHDSCPVVSHDQLADGWGEYAAAFKNAFVLARMPWLCPHLLPTLYCNKLTRNSSDCAIQAENEISINKPLMDAVQGAYTGSSQGSRKE